MGPDPLTPAPPPPPRAVDRDDELTLLPALWPGPDEVIEQASTAFQMSAVVAMLGGAWALREVSRGRLFTGGVLAGAVTALAIPPALWWLSKALELRRERARLVARALLLAFALLAGLAGATIAWGLEQAAPLWVALLVAGYPAWVVMHLGRAVVRAEFSVAGRQEDEPFEPARACALHALFVVSTLGAGAAILGPWVEGTRPLASGVWAVAGVIGCGALTTLGAARAWDLRRGPHADLELVTPEAWARIVAQREAGPRAIRDALVRDGVPPPGRRWTKRVVRAVLRATRPVEP